jgi:hypothetical protein
MYSPIDLPWSIGGGIFGDDPFPPPIMLYYS